MRRRRGEGGEKGAEVIDGNVVQPPRGREYMQKVRSVEGPELSVVVKGKLRSGGVRVQKGAQPLFIRVLRGDSKSRGTECGGGQCAKGMERRRRSNLSR